MSAPFVIDDIAGWMLTLYCSYFGKQEGDFSLELKSICARKRSRDAEQQSASASVEKGKEAQAGSLDQKGLVNTKGKDIGWVGWLSSMCIVS